MPDVAVVVPWRPGCPHRTRAWAWVRDRYTACHPDWTVHEATAPAGPWCKAAAVASVIDGLDADIVVLADADVWCPATAASVADVADGAPWAMPHDQVLRASPDGTSQILATASDPDLSAVDLAERGYRGVPGGGLVVLPRSTLLDVPLDRRFEGWGQEDVSWAVALTSLAGPCARRSASLLHLWHPPQPRSTRKVGSEAGQQLHRRYIRAARQGAHAVRQLLQEVATPCP